MIIYTYACVHAHTHTHTHARARTCKIYLIFIYKNSFVRLNDKCDTKT